MSRNKQAKTSTTSTVEQLLPRALLEARLACLTIDKATVQRLAAHELHTIGDLLRLPARSVAPRGKLRPDDRAAVQAALERLLLESIERLHGADHDDWPTLRAHLLVALDDEARELFQSAVGIDRPVATRAALQRSIGSGASLDERLDQIRARVTQQCAGLVSRLRSDLEAAMQTCDGVLAAEQAALRPLAKMFAEAGDMELGMRLQAFCMPHECHVRRGVLLGVSARRFRELMRTLPPLVPQHRLPLPVDRIAEQLRGAGVAAPRQVLLHVLRSELQIAIQTDDRHGEMAVPDPRTPAARLVEILTELDEPASLSDLVFAYRERFRFASQARVRRHLAGSKAFLRIAAETWALRQWYEHELAATAPLGEKVARWICTEGGRHRLIDLIADEPDREQTLWLVTDLLQHDPRVRLLGRGEACPADQPQSTVMVRLLKAFRRAAGDVVASRFVDNQPPAQRRLVRHLLEHNRAFVRSASDRIDMLSNYPFNAERMQRLIQVVRDHLQRRTGYAQADALKDTVDRAELGGKWLSPALLADILRRNGPFEVLSPGIVALRELALPSTLMRSARQALREVGEALTIADVVRERPDLAEFTDCLAELLCQDPLVQSPDGKYFVLA